VLLVYEVQLLQNILKARPKGLQTRPCVRELFLVLHYLSPSLFLVLVQSKEEKDAAACKTQQKFHVSASDKFTYAPTDTTKGAKEFLHSFEI
jgi:hypothetical protein